MFHRLVMTSWERTGHVLCIVDKSLSVLMTLRMCLCELCCLFGILYCLDLRMCLCELCCLFGIFYCLDLHHLVRVFSLFMFP